MSWKEKFLEGWKAESPFPNLIMTWDSRGAGMAGAASSLSSLSPQKDRFCIASDPNVCCTWSSTKCQSIMIKYHAPEVGLTPYLLLSLRLCQLYFLIYKVFVQMKLVAYWVTRHKAASAKTFQEGSAAPWQCISWSGPRVDYEPWYQTLLLTIVRKHSIAH